MSAALVLAVAICSETAKYGRLQTGTSSCFFRENVNLETFPSDIFVLQNTLLSI